MPATGTTEPTAAPIATDDATEAAPTAVSAATLPIAFESPRARPARFCQAETPADTTTPTAVEPTTRVASVRAAMPAPTVSAAAVAPTRVATAVPARCAAAPITRSTVGAMARSPSAETAPIAPPRAASAATTPACCMSSCPLRASETIVIPADTAAPAAPPPAAVRPAPGATGRGSSDSGGSGSPYCWPTRAINWSGLLEFALKYSIGLNLAPGFFASHCARKAAMLGFASATASRPMARSSLTEYARSPITTRRASASPTADCSWSRFLPTVSAVKSECLSSTNRLSECGCGGVPAACQVPWRPSWLSSAGLPIAFDAVSASVFEAALTLSMCTVPSDVLK